MTTLALGDLTEKVDTWDPSKSGSTEPFTYIDLGAVDQREKKIFEASKVFPGEAPSRARQLVRTGDVLVSTVRPNLNGVACVPENMDGATASTGFCVLRPTFHLDSSYLFQWVRSPKFISEMTRKATGQSYPAVSDRIIKESLIPIPEIREQQRIAEVLDRADALRAKRREAIALLDDLAQSIFIEIFGDVNLNDRNWRESRTLNEVADIASGITKGRKAPAAPVRPVPYLAVLNVQDKRLDLSRVKAIDVTEAEVDRYRLREGDLLLTEGGDPDKLGRGTLWRNELPECLHQNHIFRVRVNSNDEIHPVYLNWLVASERGRRYFLRSAKQTTGIASINATQLRQFPLLEPPIELQREFAACLAKLEAAKRSHLSHLAELDALFASLQYRAFRGVLFAELTLAS